MKHETLLNVGCTNAMRIVQGIMIPEREAIDSRRYFKLLDLLEYLYERGNEWL
jgi:hypothetical protein